MFREMRRIRQKLSKEETIDILVKATSGVLALLGDDDYPYAVPLSYVYSDGKIYFHSARNGHKIDAVNKYSKASFCVTAQDKVVPEEYTSYFRSVIVFGKIRMLKDEKEINEAIELLALKYNPKDSPENRHKAIERARKIMAMFVLEAEHITGKKAIELVRQEDK